MTVVVWVVLVVALLCVATFVLGIRFDSEEGDLAELALRTAVQPIAVLDASLAGRSPDVVAGEQARRVYGAANVIEVVAPGTREFAWLYVNLAIGMGLSFPGTVVDTDAKSGTVTCQANGETLFFHVRFVRLRDP